MKKLIVLFLSVLGVIFSGCSSTVMQDSLLENVAKEKGYVNHYDKPYYEIQTPQDIEDVVFYLPKNTTTVRLKMKVSNLEDIIYMKLISDDGFEIDKVIRRVENIEDLGLEQDGYMYEPSVEKNVVTLQVYVPSIYLYNGVYKPKLVFSFKRNSRSLVEMVQLYFVKYRYTVSHDNNEENPSYMTLSDYCASKNKADEEFFTQMSQVNENRIDLETIKDIENSCR